MRVEIVVPLILHTVGVYAFASILGWYVSTWRAERVGCGSPGCAKAWGVGTAIWGLSLAWFAVLSLLTLSALRPGADTRTLRLVLLVLQFLFPPLIMHMLYADAGPLRERLWRPGWRRPIAAVYVLSAASIGFCLGAVFGPLELRQGTLGRFIGIATSVLFVSAAVYAVAALRAARGDDEGASARSGRRWMTGLFGFMIALILFSLFARFGGISTGLALTWIGSALPLVFCFVAFYHESRFAFVDLFVKRGLALVTTLVLLTAYLAAVLPALDGLRLEGVRPLVWTVVLLPPVLSLPWVYRRLWAALDRFLLGRRHTPVEAIKEFLAGLQQATDPAQLAAHAERGLSAIFQAEVRIELGAGAIGLARAPDVARIVPVGSGGHDTAAIRVGPRAGGRPWLSEDLALLSSLAEVFSHLLDNMRLREAREEHERHARRLELQASRSELKALRAQVNPHFLFNALNSIAGLIHKEPARADLAVEQLAEVFRYTLRRSDSEWSLLDDELDFVQAYLDVESARFGDRLKVELRRDESARCLRIPAMVVQTLVENAIKHGVAAVRGNARIEVDARREGQRLVVEVADNGPGFGNGALEARGEGYGLRNVRERLQGYFGAAAEVTTGRDERRGMTVVRLVLPAQREAATTQPAAATGAQDRR